jgi:hypothetical protein
VKSFMRVASEKTRTQELKKKPQSRAEFRNAPCLVFECSDIRLTRAAKAGTFAYYVHDFCVSRAAGFSFRRVR